MSNQLTKTQILELINYAEDINALPQDANDIRYQVLYGGSLRYFMLEALIYNKSKPEGRRFLDDIKEPLDGFTEELIELVNLVTIIHQYPRGKHYTVCTVYYRVLVINTPGVMHVVFDIREEPVEYACPVKCKALLLNILNKLASYRKLNND